MASGNLALLLETTSLRERRFRSSAFDDYDLYCQWKDGRQASDWGVDEEGLPESDPLLDYPVIGSVLAHGIGNYWDALSKVSNGDCIWVDD